MLAGGGWLPMQRFGLKQPLLQRSCKTTFKRHSDENETKRQQILV